MIEGERMRSMDRPGWAPDEIDVERPSAARIYDYFLGGSHNFAADREAAQQIMATIPDVPLLAQANRAFLRRVIRYLSSAGVQQYLDLGSGIPTVGNVHEIAQQIEPRSRVLYVDIDPVAVAHSKEILAANEQASVIQEDLQYPDRILAHPETRALLDLSQPVAVLIVSVLHFLTDEDDPWAVTERLRTALPPGSYLAISHGASETRRGDLEPGVGVYRRNGIGVIPRTGAAIARFFTGYEMVEPGLVWIPQWRPDLPDDVGDNPERSGILGGVGVSGRL